MGKALSFGTLFKNQNDPLKLFEEEKVPALEDTSVADAALAAKAEADISAADATQKAAASAYDTEVDLAKKKKGTSLTTALGLNT